MAEAVFAHQASEHPTLSHKIKVASCGTGAYHVGDAPDERTVETCVKHKIPINSVARALQESDFYNFDHIIAMDTNNLKNIQSVAPRGSSAKVSLFSTHSETSSKSKTPISIADPYYGAGMSGFERCFKQCEDYSKGLLKEIENTA